LNYAEAEDAESIKDFIHKLKIALKELRETNVALRIAGDARLSQDQKLLEAVLYERRELVPIFVSSIKTTKKRL
jgi:four helix bundle protein